MCPSCLGSDHPKEGLSGDPCVNYGFIPWSLSAARLAEVEELIGVLLLGRWYPVQTLALATPCHIRCWAMETGSRFFKRTRELHLVTRFDDLTAKMNQMKAAFDGARTCFSHCPVCLGG